MITDQMLTDYALPVMLVGLCVFMGYIVYKLGKDSNAGKTGMIVLSIALLVGVLGFALKFVIKYALESAT